MAQGLRTGARDTPRGPLRVAHRQGRDSSHFLTSQDPGAPPEATQVCGKSRFLGVRPREGHREPFALELKYGPSSPVPARRGQVPSDLPAGPHTSHAHPHFKDFHSSLSASQSRLPPILPFLNKNFEFFFSLLEVKEKQTEVKARTDKKIRVPTSRL